MKLFIILLLISTYSPADTIPAFFKCKMAQECIGDLLENEKLWGRFSLSYKKGLNLWKKKPQVRFQNLGKEGELKLEKSGNEFTPLIILPHINDPYELVISLNHEIVHFVNSHSNLKNAGNNKKINNCLTRYRLELLKDEGTAFIEEIYFWEQAPDWFRKHFDNQFFDSKLLEKKVSYSEYYKILKQKISTDARFVEKRYIALGEYPECTKDLLR